MCAIESNNADNVNVAGALSCDLHQKLYFVHRHRAAIFPLRSSINKASWKGVGSFCSVLELECFRSR